MSFSATWNELLEDLAELPTDATLVTPLSGDAFRVTDVQEHRVLVEYVGREGTTPLQRDRFETLFRRVDDATDGFDLDRLPPDAEPYASVSSLHARFQVDDREEVLRVTDSPSGSPLVDADVRSDASVTTDASVATDASAVTDAGLATGADETSREEPDVDVYADALLLVDALERHDPADLAGMETPALVNVYTLLSDVQRNADDLRQAVRRVLLDRLHHDRPVSGQFGSVQRTTRRNRSLRDEETVLQLLEDAGIDRERVTSVDAGRVDDALAVTELAESDVYEIDESEYVRKAEVHEDEKETRLQGLKDQLDAADEDTRELRTEIEELEARIDDLTGFDSASTFHTPSEGES